jgi:hypothetical protein
MTTQSVERMQCMEVWGGNQQADLGVSMAGLDAWVYSRPYQGATGGGDVHYVSSCATGRITRLLLADVSGHGQAVAPIATSLRGLMRRYVNYLNQTKFVDEMNQQFADQSKDGTFATAIVTTFFAPTLDLTVSNAGHPPPMIYRVKKGQWSILEAMHEESARVSNLPLGVIDESHYEQFGLRLDVGDLVLCFTDSLIESKGAAGAMLDSQGLLKIVRSIAPGDPAVLISAILSKIASLHPDNLIEDDVTLLLFRANGKGRRLSIADKLATPVRLLRGLIRSLKPGGEAMPWPELSLPNIGGPILQALNRSWSRQNRSIGGKGANAMKGAAE